MNVLLERKFGKTVALALMATLPSLAGFAQASSQASPATVDPQAADQPAVLEKFVVTGSYIPVAGDAPVAPVTVVNPLQIQNTGASSNLLEVMRKSTPQFVGNANLGATNANIGASSTNGGAQLSLLNTQTLVLIDGRRVAFSPVAGIGGYQFVDLNLIPVGAVERIEVLKDGGSALYGSDAIAGVVNVIMKKDYKGFEVSGRLGFATSKGQYRERSFDMVGGAGDGKTNVTIAAEWFKSDPLYQRNRSFSSPVYGTASFPGVVSVGSNYYYLNPSLNAPPAGAPRSPEELVAAGIYTGPYGFGSATNGQIGDIQKFFDLSKKVTLLEANQRKSASGEITHQVSEHLTVFGDFLFSKTNTASQLNAQPITATIAAGENGNPFNVDVRARNRFVDYPRQYITDTDSSRGTIGIRGNLLQGWTYEAGVTYNQVSQTFRNPNLVETSSRVAAVTGGAVNLFARQQADGAILNSSILGSAWGNFDSVLWTVDGHVTGTVATIPAGPIQLAVGAEYRRESLQANSDKNSQTATFGWDSGTTLDPFNQARNVKSVFGELRVPLTSPEQSIVGLYSTSLDGAVRYEKYSDAGATTVPKISLRYQPLDNQFTIRATYSKSFTAPALYSLYGPGGIGFTPGLNLSMYGGGAAQNVQGNLQLTNNPHLTPSKADNVTLGAVFSPKALAGFSVSADAFYIKQKDLVGGVDYQVLAQDVEDKGAASVYAPFVALNDFPGSADATPITAPGQVAANIDNIYINSSSLNSTQLLRGVNVEANYTKAFGDSSRLDLSTQGVYLQTYKYKYAAGLPWVETVGQATNINGTIPRFHAYTTASYTWRDVTGFVAWTYYPGVTDPAFLNADESAFAPRKTGSYSSFDASVSYTLKRLWALSNVKLTVGANNVFNRQPPASPTFTEANVDIATYGPIGRLVYVTLGVKF